MPLYSKYVSLKKILENDKVYKCIGREISRIYKRRY